MMKTFPATAHSSHVGSGKFQILSAKQKLVPMGEFRAPETLLLSLIPSHERFSGLNVYQHDGFFDDTHSGG
ncbi:unnamed protein product [Arctogadus glacialis]